jgi:hypothetical protein
MNLFLYTVLCRKKWINTFVFVGEKKSAVPSAVAHGYNPEVGGIKKPDSRAVRFKLERAKGFEPSTFTLAR